LNSIKNTPVRTFCWNIDKEDENQPKQIGIIAEELEAAGLEEFVDYEEIDDVDNPGQKKNVPQSIAKTNLIFALWRAVQELNEKVEKLEERLNNS
jgi:hypothetical protein